MRGRTRIHDLLTSARHPGGTPERFLRPSPLDYLFPSPPATPIADTDSPVAPAIPLICEFSITERRSSPGVTC